MKVLHIFNELKYSGGEIMTEIASDIFLKNNIKSHVLSTGSQVGIFEARFMMKGYRVFHIPFKNFWRIVSPLMLFKIYKLIITNNYDIVHIHTERGRFSYSIIARLARVKKIITTVHHIFVPNKNFTEKVKIFVRIFKRWFMKNILDVLIISNSKSGLKNEIDYYKSYNLYVPNWYDNLKYNLPPNDKIRNQVRNKLNIKEDNLVFISLGGNWEYKNYDLIIRAMANLGKDCRAIYLQVGPDENKQLLKLKKKLNLGDNIKLVGQVSDTIPYLYASDVYIMPSSIEGFGVAAVEAMGTGLPAILSNRPALHDFKEDSDEIIFIEPKIDDIVDAIKLFLKMEKYEIRKKGRSISRIINQKYGIKNGAEKSAQVYLGNLKC